LSSSHHSLAVLEARLQQDLLWLNQPAKSWTPPLLVDGREVLDVAVIGSGLCGLVTLAALQRIGIGNTRAFDRATQGLEGPWITYARMETLRTRKDAAGPALGIPSLTFRAWFEAQFGAQAFLDMDLIPRAMWMEYLVWYRRVLKLDVVNDSALTGVAFRQDGLIALTFARGNVQENVLARRVFLATGLDGLGAPAMPPVAARVGSVGLTTLL